MTKRPRSSVTTIFANFVGRSVVSAMTHTPASGPFGLVTTPPRSVEPIVTSGTRGPSLGDSPEAIPTRLARGEAADVVILDSGSADELVKRGLVQAGSKVLL